MTQVIREEVEYLKKDFNYRIKQILFNSTVSAYYIGLIPICFAQVSQLTALSHSQCGNDFPCPAISV